MTDSMDLTVGAATEADVPLILRMIKARAEYERLSHEVVATEAALRDALFGARPRARDPLLSFTRRRAARGVGRVSSRRRRPAATVGSSSRTRGNGGVK